ncbi:kinetoplast-associated protein-like protein [Leishmania panamensis]|uniref:Kinetoplast-associated protein-like protein n=1 Tax=Leishmania panamensis TaxID=5679 RepID=A0A088S3C9_LEIPA|nr:kinetoplast-associated protein-like protein [Leishmania panamensis]AIN95996.1 kinetoplast-associated protein-like protein [Leishmania panamensis]
MPPKANHANDGAPDDKVGIVTVMVTSSPMPASACQTVLIQPWISLAPVAGAHGDAGHFNPSDATAGTPTRSSGGGGIGSHPPSSQRHVLMSAVRLAEINATHKELEETQRFERDEDGIDSDSSPTIAASRHCRSAVGGDDDENDKQLAAALSQAYTRVLAFTTHSRECRSLLHADDLHRGSTEGVTAEVDGDGDANPVPTRQIEEKRVEFLHRVEKILGEMRKTGKSQRELQVAQKAVQASLEDARRQLRGAQEKVQHIDRRHLREIQGYRLPPAVVKLVMDAVLCVLGEKTKNWTDVVAAMRSPSFISKVASSHNVQLTPAEVQELRKNFISNPHFSYADALKGSQALGQFYEWVMRQVQLVDAGNAHARFRAENAERIKALADARRKMKAEAAELQRLEEEIEAVMSEQTRQLQEQRSDALNIYPTNCETWSQRRSSALTDALVPAAESPGAAKTSTQRLHRTSVSPASGAAPPMSTSARLRSTAAQAAANSNAAAEACVDAAQQRSSTMAAVIAVPAGNASVPCAATDAAAMTDDDMAKTTDSVCAVNNSPTALTVAQQQQQQQVPTMMPPGSRWMYPQPGSLHSSYILRSSILCVVGHQQQRTCEKSGETSLYHNTATPAPDIVELTMVKQQLVAEALQDPKRAVLPLPPTSTTVASQRSSNATIVTQHRKDLTGNEWEKVVKDSPDDLRRTTVEDVPMICQDPDRAAVDVELARGSLHGQCAVSHPDSGSSEAVRAVIKERAYPTVMAIYKQRKRTRDWLDAEGLRERQQVAPLASLEEEVQEETEAPRETQSLRDAFGADKRPLAAQTASQTVALDDVGERLASQEALQEKAAMRQALEVTTTQLERVQALLRVCEEAAEVHKAALAESQAKVKSTEDQVTAAQVRLASAEERIMKVETDARGACAAAELSTAQAEKALEDLESQLRTTQAALVEERTRLQKELDKAQAAAAAREKQLLHQMDAMKKQLDEAQRHEKAMKAGKGRHQQEASAAADAKRAVEHAVQLAALEQKLKEATLAQAALQEEHQRLHRAFERSQAQAAANEKARLPLQETIKSVQRQQEYQQGHVAHSAAHPLKRPKHNSFEHAQVRVAEASAAFVEALGAQLAAAEVATSFCGAEMKAAAARSQRSFAAMEQEVLEAQRRAAQLEEARRTAREKLQAMKTAVAAEDAGDSATGAELMRLNSMQEHQEALSDISERVIAASAALTSASETLETHQQQRAAGLMQEEARSAKVFHEGGGHDRNRKGSDLAAQIMCKVYESTTGSFLSRRQCIGMNACLCALLLLSLTTLQYKKYHV